MMEEDRETFSYQIGGSLASRSPSYVERKADRELKKALKQGEFCYVLNSRQMGKSSLRVRVMEQLQAEGAVCIFIDLTGMGTQDLTPEKWYAGIVRSLVSSCKIKFKWRNWWREKRDLCSPAQRLGVFIEEVLLVEVSERICIFIDEIDRVLSQSFSLDDFFALIHSCYEKRQTNPDYHRLTFTLLGVAAPRDLIRDKTQSPFNMGKAINLQGFKLEEAKALRIGLAEKFSNSQEILAEILSWTRGQPFLTQKLCQLVLEQVNEKLEIEKIIDKYIINDWETQDEPEHLRTIRDRLCLRDSSKTIRLLSLYQKILQKKIITVTNTPEQIELRLSGLVVEKKGILEINNLIYARIFNSTWIEKKLAQLRPYEQALNNWITTNNSNYLLTGKDLQNTLTWALGKSLDDIDYQFLVASQEIAKQEVKNTLAKVETASKLLAISRKKAKIKADQERLPKRWLLITSLGVTVCILLLRLTGILQDWEWNILDRFFLLRLTDIQEPRITVVTIDEADINNIGQWPIPDNILATAINNIKAYNPNAIALDIFRDLPVAPGTEDLRKIFISTPNLYVVEKVIGESVSPPPNINQQQVGFADQILDSDGKIRRGLLSLVKDNKQTRFSLGTQLALHYLRDKNINLQPIENNSYRLGKATFKRFNGNNGGYVRSDAGGYQILINYWGTEQNFQQYSLTEILNNQVTDKDIENRLILIGSTAESIKDFFYTPYSNSNGWFRSPQRMPGVFIQANITSQIVSAALDDRPLLYTKNGASESIFILFCGITGTIISWYLKTYFKITIYILLAAFLLIISCYIAFLLGWWLPFVPSLLSLVTTAITFIIIRDKQREKLRFNHTLALLLKEYKTIPIEGRIALEYLKQSENKNNQIIIDKQIQKLTKK